MVRRFRTASALASLTLVLVLPASVGAEPERGSRTPEAKRVAGAETPLEAARLREAEARHAEGVAAYAAGRYKEAADQFLRADALVPSAAHSYNAALAHEKLLDSAGALRHYRDYLRRSPKARKAVEVRRRIAALEAELVKHGLRQLTVLSSPPGATVSVDELPVGVSPWTGELSPGKHRVEVTRPGYEARRLDVELTGERSREIAFELELADTGPRNAASGEAPATAPVSLSRDAEPSNGFGAWPWISVGVGSAALIAALELEVLRRSAEEEARRETTQLGYLDAKERMERRQMAARVFAGAGGALLATGALLLLLEPDEPESARASVACSDTGCVGGFFTRF